LTGPLLGFNTSSMSEPLSLPAQILRDLIRCPSVTPEEGGALDVLQERLERLGFAVERRTSSAPNTPDVENLYARLGTESPNLCFAGHTDVVPVGDEAAWSAPPFGAEVRDGFMYGRGAVDMKGGIACFIAAVEERLAAGKDATGSISLLITGDEEGPAINGTRAVLEWLAEKGEVIDVCVLGEPTNPDMMGDAIKIGRRGSISGEILVHGVQGHAAYPHLADNASRGATAIAHVLMAEPYDEGTNDFQPTNLEVTSIDLDNPAFNVVPAKARLCFNVRFNDTYTADSMKAEIERRCALGAANTDLRPGRDPVKFEIEYQARPSHVFLTRDEALVDALSVAVSDVTGRKAELSTGGGTSDGRFIKDVCPVAEFGLVGQTMHQVDERVALEDLETLTAIYDRFIDTYFERAASS
jgi:succinyl-diaminopimelate desuccinylase